MKVDKVDEVLIHICIVDDSYTDEMINDLISQARQQLKGIILECLPEKEIIEPYKPNKPLKTAFEAVADQDDYTRKNLPKIHRNNAIAEVRTAIEELFKEG